jgi:hypothetical protein
MKVDLAVLELHNAYGRTEGETYHEIRSVVKASKKLFRTRT